MGFFDAIYLENASPGSAVESLTEFQQEEEGVRERISRSMTALAYIFLQFSYQETVRLN